MGNETASTAGSMAGMAMDHVHSCDAEFDPSKPYHYGHGAYTGHMLPGYFFFLWSAWWAINIFINYAQSAGGRRQYTSRTWYSWPGKPQWLARVPLEPIAKILLPFIGINGELWAGHESWRSMYADTGIFNVDNLNDWQHSCMYLAFMISGVIDLLGTRRKLPQGTEQGFLALAFLTEGILLGFHLKGPDFEVIIHKLLVYTIVGCCGVILAEGAFPNNPLLSLARVTFVMLQGTWFMQIAKMMYNMPFKAQWHPCYMGSAMFAPVVYALHLLVIFFTLVMGLVIAEVVYEFFYPSQQGGAARYHKVSSADEETTHLVDTIELVVPPAHKD